MGQGLKLGGRHQDKEPHQKEHLLRLSDMQVSPQGAVKVDYINHCLRIYILSTPEIRTKRVH